jgi:hypothetical protein
VGAVVNQRPDLFAAALPAVGVMDMLRFNRWTAGRYWVDDYGYPDREADFRTLWSYSPYHNIRSGKDYPAVLVTTADTDDRVVPGTASNMRRRCRRRIRARSRSSSESRPAPAMDRASRPRRSSRNMRHVGLHRPPYRPAGGLAAPLREPVRDKAPDLQCGSGPA